LQQPRQRNIAVMSMRDRSGIGELIARYMQRLFFRQMRPSAIARRLQAPRYLLGLGVNAAQAAAQAFAANDQAANLSAIPQDEGSRQSLAVLIANGVHVQGVELNDGSELLRLALQGCDRDLMKSDNAFIRELACLHGLAPEARHAEMFRTVFDQDDDLVMDAVDQLQDYPSP
jgi:hypothetical protein